MSAQGIAETAKVFEMIQNTRERLIRSACERQRTLSDPQNFKMNNSEKQDLILAQMLEVVKEITKDIFSKITISEEYDGEELSLLQQRLS